MSKTKSKSGSRTQSGAATPAAGERGPNRPPRPARTLAFGTSDEAAGTRPAQKAQAQAASWRTRGRDLVRVMEKALASSREDAVAIAAIERASAAFDLSGVDLDTIQRVAHLVGRAYEALHEPPVTPSTGGLRGCAHVLYNGLPRRVREKTTFVKIEEIVSGLAGEAEAFPAVVRASADLLGWGTEALNHAGHAIRLALATKPEPIA